MNNSLLFQYVENDEFEDYYYNIICDGELNGIIEYDGFEWNLSQLYYDDFVFNWNELIQIANKLLQLNAATKADKLFGFL